MIDNFTHQEVEKLINYKSFDKTNVKNILITGVVVLLVDI